MPDLETIGPRLPRIARKAIESFLGGGGFGAFDPGGPPAPVFVTLRAPDGALRGCIGTVAATKPDVVSETVRSAVLAATRDPRFPPVSMPELRALLLEVSVLHPEEEIPGPHALDPRRYGVVVRDGSGRRGLLLPDIPGIGDPRQQVDVARKKAGIPQSAEVALSRFLVSCWKEP